MSILTPLLLLATHHSIRDIGHQFVISTTVSRAAFVGAECYTNSWMASVIFHKFDSAVIKLVSTLPSALHPFFVGISYIGHPITTSFIGFAIVLYAFLKHHPKILLSGTLIWAALIVSTALKHLTERARPLTEYVAGMQIHSFSFPSGHTTGSTVAFGLLAYFGYHLLPAPLNYTALTLLVLLVVLVGVSRIYLGAHYPTDVIGGWLLGGAALCIIIFVIKPLP